MFIAVEAETALMQATGSRGPTCVKADCGSSDGHTYALGRARFTRRVGTDGEREDFCVGTDPSEFACWFSRDALGTSPSFCKIERGNSCELLSVAFVKGDINSTCR